MENEHQRVLSIQSHVVSGYVGNKAAVFPLQLLGFDVDVVNSVHFSNHTGYPSVEGDVLNGEQLGKILHGLKSNGLLANVGHLLTGYIGSESFLRAVLDVLRTARSCNKTKVRYVCDPVLGDNGKFYVPEELVAIYRSEVIPLANVVTPNQFEVEQLTGITVKNISDAKRACKALHMIGPELVFITSMILDDDEQSITILASRRRQGGEGGTSHDEIWRIDSPIISGSYTGTGDLCAALLLAWTAREPCDLPSAMEKVCGSMWTIIKLTSDSSGDSVSSQELRLIQSKGVIEQPPELYKAQRLS